MYASTKTVCISDRFDRQQWTADNTGGNDCHSNIEVFCSMIEMWDMMLMMQGGGLRSRSRNRRLARRGIETGALDLLVVTKTVGSGTRSVEFSDIVAEPLLSSTDMGSAKLTDRLEDAAQGDDGHKASSGDSDSDSSDRDEVTIKPSTGCNDIEYCNGRGLAHTAEGGGCDCECVSGYEGEFCENSNSVESIHSANLGKKDVSKSCMFILLCAFVMLNAENAD